MEKVEFYKCSGSSSVFMKMRDEISQQCGKGDLELLATNIVEASQEKHLPVITFSEDMLTVKVGSTPNPMTQEHFIAWIFVETRTGGIYRNLTPGDEATAVFPVKEEDIIGVFAYCNLHGLLKTDITNFEFNETVCDAEFTDSCIG